MWILPITNRSGVIEFNVDDYKRVISNIKQVASMASVSIVVMPDVTYMDYPFARILNAIEVNLKTLSVEIFEPPNFITKTWAQNQTVPSPDDANRWERYPAIWYEYLARQEALALRLPTRLNGGRF